MPVHTVLLNNKIIKGGCCCLLFWLGGVHYHEKKELVKFFNKNGVEITVQSHLRSIGDRTYKGTFLSECIDVLFYISNQTNILLS